MFKPDGFTYGYYGEATGGRPLPYATARLVSRVQGNTLDKIRALQQALGALERAVLAVHAQARAEGEQFRQADASTLAHSESSAASE